MSQNRGAHNRRGGVLFRSVGAALALVLALVGLVVPAQAAAGMLPFTVTNKSGLSDPTYLYVMARDQASGKQGWVDAEGTWHAFDLPLALEDGTPPPPAPDTAIPGPANGESVTLQLRAGLVSGRIYMSFANELKFFMAVEGVVEPAGWVESDPNHNTLFDWVEFARDGSRFFINTTMVDAFSVPLSVSVVHGDGRAETQGRLVANGRQRIFDDMKAYGWEGLIQYRADGTMPLRAIAPIHGVEDGTIPADYFTDYVNAAWSYYTTTPLTVTTAMGSFTGKVAGGKFVFRDAAGAIVGTFSKFSTTDIFACEGSTQPLGQPNHHAALAIGARLCAAFNRGTLSTASFAGSDVQATHDAASFYRPGVASNLYSKAMHRSEANGNAYGFAFDDVAEFSPSINSENPSSGNMTVTPFTGGATSSGGKPVTASVESLFGHWTYGGYSDDPVNVATGNFTQAEPVLDFPVPWTPNVALAYNSRDTRAGPFGPGWSSSLTESVTENEDGSASVRWPDGSTVDYTVGADNTYVTPVGVDATLTRSSAGWATSRPDSSGETFDNAGRVLSFRDPDGRVVTITRAWSGQVVSIDGAGYSVTPEYSSTGLITSVTSSDGRTSTLTYDSSGRLTGVTDPAGGTRAYTYDDEGYLASITDADGKKVVDNLYDADGRVLEQSRPGQPTEVFEYDEDHGSTRITDPAGALVMAYTFDEIGRLTAMTAADGTTTTRTYDASGRPAESTDRAGAVTATTWTATGQVASVTANGATTTYEYDAAARPTKVTGPSGEVVSYTYEGTSRVPTGAALPSGASVDTETDGSRLSALTDADGRTSRYTYDAQGNIASLTAPSGAVTSYARDGAGRITSTTAPDGGVTQLEYDAASRIVKQTDQTGAVTATTYTKAGRVATITDPDGLRIEYAYDAAGRVLSATGPDGAVTSYAYDARGDLASAVNPLGVETTYTSDLFGRVATSTRDGVTTTYAYDADGRRTAVETGGQSISVQYDDAGRMVGSTDADGNLTRFGYDAQGRLLSTTAPDGTTTTSTYDVDGNETSRRDPLGRTSTATYTAAGLLASSIDPMGYTTGYAYDPDGRLATVTTPGNHTWSYAYDAAGRAASVTSPAGLVTSYGYDAAGRVTSATNPGSGTVSSTVTDAGRPTAVTDAAGASVIYTYDDAGRMASSTDAVGGTTTYAYDDAGHVTARTEPRGGITSFTYTDGGNVASVTDPLDRVTTYGYDSRGNVTRVEDPDGQVTTYSYDRVGRLTARTDPSGATSSWTYDVTGRRTSMTDATGTTAYTYDTAGQVTSITAPGGKPPFTFTYDGNGRVATTTYPDGTIVTNGRDPDGNLAAVTDNRGSYLAYSLDADGRVTREGSSAGAVRTFSYLDGLLSGYTEQLGAQAPTVTTRIARDVNGRITTLTTDGATTAYGYDAAGQLTSADSPSDADRTYTYDDAGNRATATTGTSLEEYHYDAANQLTQVDRDGQAWSTGTYDGAGRLTGRTVTDGSALELAYDGSGAPTHIAVEGPGTAADGRTVADLARDGDGNPVSVDWTIAGEEPTSGTTTLDWLPDTRGVPAVAALSTAETTTSLIRGAGGALLQTSTDTVVADVSRDVFDSILGSDVLGLTGTSFDEYGLPTGTPGTSVVSLGYRGTLTVAGIPLMSARAYEPSTGSFTATDPLAPVAGQAASGTPYPYVNNDPLNLIDPLGLRSVSDGAFSFSDFAWGFADGLTFGLTREARQNNWVGLTDNVNYTGFSYKSGTVTGTVTGTVAATVATGGTGTILVAGAYSGASAAYTMPAVFENRQASFGEIAFGAGLGTAFAGGGLVVQNAFARVPAAAGAGLAAPARFTTTSAGVTIDRAAVSATVSVQAQGRHVLGASQFRGPSYFNSIDDAQRVLDDFHSGTAEILGVKGADVVVSAPGVTGINVNVKSGYPSQLTSVFFIKGTRKVSVVPFNPTWTP